MKRELTKDEKTLEQKGLDRNKKELERLKGNLEYNQALIDKQKYLREFDNTWRNFLQNQKDIEDAEVIKMITSEIKLKEEAISVAEDHLKNGVEVKTPKGVY